MQKLKHRPIRERVEDALVRVCAITGLTPSELAIVGAIFVLVLLTFGLLT